MAALTLRLDEKTDRALRRLTSASGGTRSAVVRRAILLLAREEGSEGGESPYEKVAHLVGVVQGGPDDLSERTGERFAALVHRKGRGRAR